MLDLVPEKYKYPISDLLSESVWCGLVRITELEFASLEFVRTSETGERTTKRFKHWSKSAPGIWLQEF